MCLKLIKIIIIYLIKITLIQIALTFYLSILYHQIMSPIND